MSCSVGRRRGLDPALLWLWYKLGATALFLPLAWELPYVAGVALKRLKEKKKTIRMNPLKFINVFRSKRTNCRHFCTFQTNKSITVDVTMQKCGWFLNRCIKIHTSK